jgi:hypothetical protein
MKNKYIILFLSTGLVFVGAGCKKILNQPVLGNYTPGNFFTSDANAQLAINDAYKYLAFNSGATNAIWVLGDLASDDAVKGGSSIGDQPITRRSTNSISCRPMPPWKRSGKIITTAFLPVMSSRTG